MSNFFQNLADRVNPPPRTVTTAAQRDSKAAGTRRGLNGTGLSRRERAQHLDDTTLRRKVSSARDKAGRAVGGLGRQAGKAKLSAIGGHWHATPGAVITAGSNLADTGKQSLRFHDYETELLERRLDHDDDHTSRFWSSVGDGVRGKKGATEKRMKPVQKALKTQHKLEKSHEANDNSGSYYHPDGNTRCTIMKRIVLISKSRSSTLHVY